MAQFQNINGLKQSLEAQRNNLKKLDEDIKRLKSEGADSNNISQKEEKLENDKIEYNSNMDILNEYKKLEEGIEKIKDLEEKKNDSTDYPTCYALDKQILEEQNLLELSYLSLCNNIQDLKNNKEISDIIFNTPKQVNANKIDANSDKDFDFPELREKLKGMNEEHEKRISKLTEELKKAETQDGKHSPKYLQIESNIESEKSYIHDKEEMISAIGNLEEISKDYINEAIKKEKEKLERYKKDLKELPKEATQSLIDSYNNEIKLINSNIDMLENESKDIDEYNTLVVERKNLDIKIRDKNGFEAHKYERERYLKDREINAIAGKLSTYDYTNAIILGSPTKEKEQKKGQPSPTTATTTTTPKPSTSKTGSNISSDVISEMQKYYDELIKEGHLVGPQKFAGNGYASELKAVKEFLAKNGGGIKGPSGNPDLEDMKEYYRQLIAEGSLVGPLKFPGDGYASELKAVQDYLLSNGENLQDVLANEPQKGGPGNPPNNPPRGGGGNGSPNGGGTNSNGGNNPPPNNPPGGGGGNNPPGGGNGTNPPPLTAEEIRKIIQEELAKENEEIDDFEEVEKLTPWEWVKTHQKQIVIGAGIVILAATAAVVITQLLPAITTVMQTNSILSTTEKMVANGSQWALSNSAQKNALHLANEALSKKLIGADFNKATGVWTVAGEHLNTFIANQQALNFDAMAKIASLVPGVSIAAMLGSATTRIGHKYVKNRSLKYIAVERVLKEFKNEEFASLEELEATAAVLKKKIEDNTKLEQAEKEKLLKKLNKISKKKIDNYDGPEKATPEKGKDPMEVLAEKGIDVDSLTEEMKKQILEQINLSGKTAEELTDEDIEKLKDMIDTMKGPKK